MTLLRNAHVEISRLEYELYQFKDSQERMNTAERMDYYTIYLKLLSLTYS